MTTIAVVGAGAAGLAAAYALRDADAEVIVFERRESVGGRMATHRRDGCVYDVGANYCKDTEGRDPSNPQRNAAEDGDERVAELIAGELSEGLVDTEGPVWTFDADGTVSEGRDDDARKWTYRDGLATLGERLRHAADAAIRTDTEVTGLARRDDGWRVEIGGDDALAADSVVLTPPAPTTAYLLDRADWEPGGEAATRRADESLRDDLVEAAAAVPYRTILTVALHYDYRPDLPYYALVNADRGHDLGWVAREECKPGHVPDGESLLVVQPSPEWSRDRYDDGDTDVAVAAADRTAELLGDPDRYEFDWADVVRWRDALPDAGADRDALARGADADLYFAGDWVAGDGRVYAALRTGLDAGERVRERI